MMNPTVPPDDHQQAVLNMSKMGMNGKGPMRISGSKQPFLAGSLPPRGQPSRLAITPAGNLGSSKTM
ncbi:hypothetical protein EFV37_03390 [Mesorhizobium loti]|uniref:Uncharacterized protein n=1 Tax=Mesorhizobium jarvisii TaxID=1777867 RepID=A0A6M7TB72_9HYPH|nr:MULTISPECIES: hypothetical protein [Mesorhizobium]OBQ60508.1 hypothetical protein A9K72_24000 [Mesorhizobium loti]QKC61458.1 hypothetical protein EB229_03390 [Mesorhizobium jarvisii]QKD07367.1 hypothetical protein EFV37_03390 [Mesorhizobium loti]RJT31710.1 hypothetical protein D3242_21525 [Mesorhizobium jarvisii]